MCVCVCVCVHFCVCLCFLRAHFTKSGHFAPAYLVGSNKLRASLEVSLCFDLTEVYPVCLAYSTSNVTDL